MLALPKVVIIELGSQYTLLIERALRELGVRSVILGPAKAEQWIAENPVQAVILSGGAASVYDVGAPRPPEKILSLKNEQGGPIAILGICYGMQWLAQRFGGSVEAVPAYRREYGENSIIQKPETPMFEKTPSPQKVWMSHGDSVVRVPPGFDERALSGNRTIAAMQNDRIWGVQFHPEVTHTTHGKTILDNFLKMAGCEPDWKPSSMVPEIQRNVLTQLKNGKVIFGFSGGVDSTTVASILSVTLGNRLLAVTIDGGQLREGELHEIRLHAEAANVTLLVMDAREAFARVMANTIDAEEKRKRFKQVYASFFIQAANDFGATAVIQGTLAPDRIESGATGGAVIKSHHNVGLDMEHLLQLHPVDHLFKYEIRGLAKEIGLPESVWNRQPFPGPGLFLRVNGTPATPEKLDIVRWADARVREILVKHCIYENISQLVVSYVGVNTVGVKGDGRVYGGAIVVRAIETADFMTAEGMWFPKEVVSEIKRVLTSHPSIVRVWFDPTDKPPATTEME